MNEQYKLKYLVLPDFAYEEPKHSALSLKVYGFINSFKGEKFYFSNENMAEMFKVSAWSVSQAIQKLVLLGYIRCDYEVKQNGGKIRFIENLKSDCGKTHRQTVGKPTDKDNKGKEIVSKDTMATAFGNELVNFIVESFKELTGFEPTDPQPRRHAFNLSRQVAKLVKEAGFDPSSEDGQRRIKGILRSYFAWLSNQGWSVQTMSTVYYKFKMYYGIYIEEKHAKTS